MLEEKFILTPIENIMEEAADACSMIGGGIELYPVSEYIFQSLFLKMTGAQEQKLRCICWYIASFDYQFRYDYLDKYKDLHQFSAQKDKNAVWGLINGLIRIHDDSKFQISLDDRDKMVKEVASNIASILGQSILSEWNKRQYQDFKKWATNIQLSEIAEGGKLLSGKLYAIYEEMYDSRNKYAHNTLSYQQNIPSLKSLTEGKVGNFYCWFFLLALIDKLFINRFNVAKDIIRQAE